MREGGGSAPQLANSGDEAGNGIYTCHSLATDRLPILGTVVHEGTGSAMTLRLAATEATTSDTFVDGDRVALRVDVGGKRVLDHVRFVHYEDRYPNGDGCPPHCRVADVEIWPGAPTCQTCASGRCEPYVRFEGVVPVTDDTGGPASVTACKNGDCETGRVLRWDWGSTYPFSRGDGGTMAELADRFSPTLDVAPLGKHGFRVGVTFRGDARSFERGDRFTVEVRAEGSGKVLMGGDETADEYEESYAGGRECTPVVCRTRTFEMR